jgi:hypothetical protein
MSFSADDRAWLARLADVLIPIGEGALSASQAEVGGRGLDLVLAARPDLENSLAELISKTRRREAEAAVAELRTNDAAAFGLLAEFAAAAYFMNPDVQRTIGYAGQTPLPIDPHPDYLDDGLLEEVVRRGPIYRPTPDRATRQ